MLLSNSLAAFVHQRPPCARAPLLRPGTSLQGGDRRCLVVAQDIEEPGDDRFDKNLLGDALQMVLKSMGMGRDDVAEEVWAARQTLEEEDAEVDADAAAAAAADEEAAAETLAAAEATVAALVRGGSAAAPTVARATYETEAEAVAAAEAANVAAAAAAAAEARGGW